MTTNLCASTFQAHKSIRPNAGGLPSLVESRIGNRDHHDRRICDDARVEYGEKIVYHIRATCACFNCLSLSKKKKESRIIDNRVI